MSSRYVVRWMGRAWVGRLWIGLYGFYGLFISKMNYLFAAKFLLFCVFRGELGTWLSC